MSETTLPISESNNLVKKVENVADKLRRFAILNAQGWAPESDTTLSGEIVSIVRGESAEYADYPIVTLEKEDGEFVAIHAFHTLLQEPLRIAKAKVGDTLDIWYGGERPVKSTKGTKDERNYHLYSVLVNGENPEHAEPWEW